MKSFIANIKNSLYIALGEHIQSWYSRLQYKSKSRPRINKRNSGSCMYPANYKGCLIISADLELAWGWHWVKNNSDPLSFARNKAHQTRENFPKLLSLFEQFGIPITWATVGHLFLENCERDNGIAHPGILRLPHFTNEFWSYTKGDWFDGDPGSNSQAAPEWYAPDLISQILDSPVKHEIACHTFSHINMSDVCYTQAIADTEIHACCKVAEEWGIELKSFVFPGNIAGNFASLKKYGFTGYRMENFYQLDYPKRDKYDLWRIPGGICLEKPFSNWRDEYWVNILKNYIDLALEYGFVCHFWFHPSAAPETFDVILPRILEHIRDKQGVLWCTTMNNLVRWLDRKK